MSPGVKAVMVILGLFGFFMIPVVGPMLADAGTVTVQTVLGVDDETAVENKKVRENKAYLPSGDLGKAKQCCLKCDADWNHFEDRCDIQTQSIAKCYTKTCAK